MDARASRVRRSAFSDALARSELVAMERDARHAFFCQTHDFLNCRENQRRARMAVNQAVQETSECYEVLMMTEF